MKSKRNLIRDIRLSRGLTIAEMAREMGLSASSITSAENSDNVSQKIKARALKVYGLDDAFFEFIQQQKKLEEYEEIDKNENDDKTS